MKSPSEKPKSSSESPRAGHYIAAVALVVILISTAVSVLAPTINDKLLSEAKQLNQVNPLIATEQMFDDLPDSPFKSNLLIVMGAHLSGSDQQLNQLLTAYAEIEIERLERNK